MRRRKRLILPLVGLFLFAAETYHSVRTNQDAHLASNRYFWWSLIRLDSDPLQRHPQTTRPCRDGEEGCVGWDLRAEWVDPALTTSALIVSALLAFVMGALIVRSLGHFGINKVWTFMISMPVLILAWFYLVSWPIDRWYSRDGAKLSALAERQAGRK